MNVKYRFVWYVSHPEPHGSCSSRITFLLGLTGTNKRHTKIGEAWAKIGAAWIFVHAAPIFCTQKSERRGLIQTYIHVFIYFSPRSSDYFTTQIGAACTEDHAAPIWGHATPIFVCKKIEAACTKVHAAPIFGHAAPIFVAQYSYKGICIYYTFLGA